MRRSGYRSPGRRGMRDELARAKPLPPIARGLPRELEEDKAFMDLFYESKRIEWNPRKRNRFHELIGQMRARWTEVMGHG